MREKFNMLDKFIDNFNNEYLNMIKKIIICRTIKEDKYFYNGKCRN